MKRFTALIVLLSLLFAAACGVSNASPGTVSKDVPEQNGDSTAQDISAEDKLNEKIDPDIFDPAKRMQFDKSGIDTYLVEITRKAPEEIAACAIPSQELGLKRIAEINDEYNAAFFSESGIDISNALYVGRYINVIMAYLTKEEILAVAERDDVVGIHAFDNELAQPETVEDIDDGFTVPEDFAFSLIWGTYGISSYDSVTHRLVKTSDTSDPDKYTACAELSAADMKTICRILTGLDLSSYPASFDPFNAPGASIQHHSEPNQTIIVTVTANGVTNTVRCEGIGFFSLAWCYDGKAGAFYKAVKDVIDILTSTPEWQAFPDYEKYYR